MRLIQIPRLLVALNADDLVSRPVILVVSGYLTLSNLLDLYTTFNNLPFRVALLLVSFALLFALLSGAVAIAKRIPNARWSAGVLLIGIVVAALTRSLVLAWLLWRTGFDAEMLWRYRVGAGIYQSVIVVVTWAWVSAVRLHYQRLRALVADTAQLRDLKLRADHRLETEDLPALEEIRQRILSGLAVKENADVQELLARLESTVEDVVRPLSRQLESEAPAWVPPAQTLNIDYRISWWRALLRGADPRSFQPTLIWLTAMLLVLPAWTAAYGFLFVAEYFVLTTGITLPLGHAAKRMAIAVTRDRHLAIQGMSTLVLLLINAASYGLLTLPLTKDFDRPLPMVGAAGLISIIFGVLWSIATAAQRQARSTQSELRNVRAQLRWQLARTRELHRQHRRALAHAVHGRIQATLAAGILQLEAAVKNDEASEALLGQVHARVTDEVRQLNLRSIEQDSLEMLLAKLRESWAGIAKISLSIESATSAAVERDSQVLTTFNDLLPELAFNSIKHGHATEISFVIRELENDTVELLAIDNGQPYSTYAGPGMGTRLFDDCAVEWSRRRDGDKTVIRLSLPLLQH